MDTLKNLGNKSKYLFEYSSEMLESFDNKHPENDTMVKFNCPEFTSLCPITGQPDFATIYLSYIPDQKLVESKSLKLYLFSFRNHGAFHEDCTVRIGQELTALLNDAGLKVIETRGISFSVGRGLHLSDDLALNYMMSVIAA